MFYEELLKQANLSPHQCQMPQNILLQQTYYFGVLQSKNFDLTSNVTSSSLVAGNVIFTCKLESCQLLQNMKI